MDASRGQLCPRCGAVLRATTELEPYEEECPECGLEYSSQPLMSGRLPVAEHTAALQRHAERRMRVFDECTFEVYGLDPGWEGGRWIRGWGRSRNVLTSVTLQHGPADLEAPSVSVETSIKQHAWHELAPTLAEQLYHDGAEASGSLRATFATKQPTSSWDSLILTVGGHPMEWRSLSGPHSWVAIARIDAAVVAIHANRLDPPSCRLASVDIGDYRSDPTGMFPEDPE